MRAPMVSQLVSQGGFPQLLLPPVNFEALYLSAAGSQAGLVSAPIAESAAAPGNLHARIAVLGAGPWGRFA